MGLKKIWTKEVFELIVITFKRSFLIGGQEIGEIIPFPVWIIRFPIFKTSFKLVDKIEKHFVKEVI